MRGLIHPHRFIQLVAPLVVIIRRVAFRVGRRVMTDNDAEASEAAVLKIAPFTSPVDGSQSVL